MLWGAMTSPPPPYRIVIVSQNASTRYGGEAILPVHYFRILRARGADVHLVIHERNRADMTAYFNGDVSNMAFVADTCAHRIIAWLHGVSNAHVVQIVTFNIGNLWTEWLQRHIVVALLDERPEAIVHVPTPVSPRAVSLLSGLRAPVVFGPMNGDMTFPPGYTKHRGRAQQWVIDIGRSAAGLANRLLPAKRRAARLLVANDRTAAALPVEHGDRVVRLVENGVQTDLWHPPATPREREEGPFRLVFVGRLVDWKAVDVTLRALAMVRARGVDATLDVVGEGVERARLEALAVELGLADAATFHGFLLQPEAARILTSRDALILNSLFECGGAAVLEAMATALPVIASAWGGPLDYLDETCGLLVHPSPPDTFPDRLADAIVTLAADPERARRMGAAGRERILDSFDWNKKVDRILEIFDEVAATARIDAKARLA